MASPYPYFEDEEAAPQVEMPNETPSWFQPDAPSRQPQEPLDNPWARLKPVNTRSWKQQDADIWHSQQMQVAEDLVERFGYTHEELRRAYENRLDLRGFYPKQSTRKQPNPQDEAIKEARRREFWERPYKREVDPVTGEISESYHTRDGMDDDRRTKKDRMGNPLYEKKAKAWTGETPEGGKWSMNRGEWGQAEGYDETKPPASAKKREHADKNTGQRFWETTSPDGTVTREPMTDEEGRNLYREGEWKGEDRPGVKWTQKRDTFGSPEPGTYEENKTGLIAKIARESRDMDREIKRFTTQLEKIEAVPARERGAEGSGKIGQLREKIQELRDRKAALQNQMSDEAIGAATAMTPEEWLEQNPDDPRAPAIRAKLERSKRGR